MKRILGIILVLLVLGSCKEQKAYREMSGADMHTTYHIKYEYTEDLTEEIRKEFRRFYHSINPFDSTSIISAINRNRDVEVDSFFIEVFRKAIEISEKTSGVFDITCAPLINAWGFGFRKMDTITPCMIDSIREFVGYRKVRLNGNRVIKDDPRILLNCSALGDGSLCDLVAALFEKKGIENYMVEFGGEVMAKGVNPQGKCWRVGIVKPVDDPDGYNQEFQQVIELCGRKGLATSGNYRNFYVKDGKKYAHTIDPRTGYPAEQDVLSATVIAPDCKTADAYATAFMALGSAGIRQLKSRLPEIEYFIICTDSVGTLQTEYSEGLKAWISE